MPLAEVLASVAAELGVPVGLPSAVAEGVATQSALPVTRYFVRRMVPRFIEQRVNPADVQKALGKRGLGLAPTEFAEEWRKGRDVYRAQQYAEQLNGPDVVDWDRGTVKGGGFVPGPRAKVRIHFYNMRTKQFDSQWITVRAEEGWTKNEVLEETAEAFYTQSPDLLGGDRSRIMGVKLGEIYRAK